MRTHTSPPSCESVFSEEEDRWVVTSDCGSSTCASSTSCDVNAAVQRGLDQLR